MKTIKFLSIFYHWKRLLIVSIFSCFFVINTYSQDTLVFRTRVKPKIQRHWADLGIGFGLDYGGLAGVKIAFLPISFLSIFGNAGYILSGFGWNAGITVHILPSTSRYSVRPNIKVMYGVNASTYVRGTSKYNDVYIGLTPGIGIEFMFGSKKKNGIDIDINVPIRSSEYYNTLSAMKHDKSLTSVREAWPVTFSFGYHHEF